MICDGSRALRNCKASNFVFVLPRLQCWLSHNSMQGEMRGKKITTWWGSCGLNMTWQTLAQKEICCQGNTFQTEIMQSRRRSEARFSNVPKTFPARKAIPKTPISLFCKAVFFSYVVKGIKIKTTAKFRTSRRLRFEDTKEYYVTWNAPEKFRDFRETGPRSRLKFNQISFDTHSLGKTNEMYCLVLF